MKRTSFARWPCSIARTVDLVGDWWTPLVLREAFYGVTRFEDWQRNLGLGRNVLAERLKRLVAEDMLARHRYQEHPELDGGRGAPVALRHLPCGHLTRPEVVCGHCRQPLTREEVQGELGPGFPPKLRTLPLVEKRFARKGERVSS